jgi:hypothetical protein
MKSPFPGMDPFIEACGLWEDLHTHLIEDIYRQLADAVPDRYVVRSGERNYLVVANEEIPRQRPFKPGVTNTARAGAEDAGQSEGAVAVAEPAELTMRAYVEEGFREPFVEVLEIGPENRLVTCVELLSPSNKRFNSPGWDQYLRKRQGLLQGHETNLVEIDLLRGGRRMPMFDPWPNSPYAILIARASKVPNCGVIRADFRTRLPPIAIPLLKPDSDISIDLQPTIEASYARSKYYRTIDYSKPIMPPLAAEDELWLRERLRAEIA